MLIEQYNYYKMNTIKCDRGLTEYYNNGFNYDNGGIIAQCPTKYLKKSSKFKVAILVNELNGEKYLIQFEDDIIV